MQARGAFATGEFCRLGRIEFTAEAIMEFAAAYDPQPQHLTSAPEAHCWETRIWMANMCRAHAAGGKAVGLSVPAP
jgi:hypothetical protein